MNEAVHFFLIPKQRLLFLLIPRQCQVKFDQREAYILMIIFKTFSVQLLGM